jgi:hypothetical protein
MGDTDLTKRIRQRAYKIWESEGRPHGCDSAHWLRAEAEIREGLKAPGPSENPPKLTGKASPKSTPPPRHVAKSPQQRPPRR